MKRFADFLSDCNIEFFTLKDLGITEEPDETGTTPEENAIIKAKFYEKITSFMDKESSIQCSSFFMVDKPSEQRHEGWPLDSLSIYKETDEYFVDKTVEESKKNIILGMYKEKILEFLKQSLK